jgi:deoxyribodipyrimidine photo-lyase
MVKPEINIVWFKRDLRFTDYEHLYFAQQSTLPLLLVYIFEPSVMAFHDSDPRHWRFIHESLKEMNLKLKELMLRLQVFTMKLQLFLKP